MATYNVVGEWSSGNVNFKSSTGDDIVYLDGTNKQVVAAKQTVTGSLIASSSAAISGQLTATKKVIGSSDASVAGTFTMGATGTMTVPYNVFNCPEIRGRVDFDITTNSSVGVCGGLVNPSTIVLLIEKVHTRVTTASSAGNAISLGVVATYTSGSNIADATIASNATGITGLASSGTFPVEWSTGYYLVAYKALASTAIVAKVTAYYTGIVST